MIILETKIDFKDYLKLNYKIYYRKVVGIILQIFGIVTFVFGLVSLSLTGFDSSSPVIALVFGLYITVLIPLITYRASKKTYKANKVLNGSVTYQFYDHYMEVDSEDLKSEVNLNSLYKIEEIADWFLFHSNKNLITNIVSKKNMSENEIHELRIFLSKLEGVTVV